MVVVVGMHGSLGTGDGETKFPPCDARPEEAVEGRRERPALGPAGARLGRLAVRLMADQESRSSSLDEELDWSSAGAK